MSQTRSRNGQSGVDIAGLTEQLRGNSPDEVLGSMNQASLTQGIVMASVVTAVLMAVLTIGPFLMGSGSPKKKGGKPVAAAQNKEETPAAAQNNTDGDTAADESANTKTGAGGQPKVSAKALKNLGVDDVKQSDPKRNPLEDSVDDLLKDIK